MNNYFVHHSSIIDEGCQIGIDTKIWHFSHVMPLAIIGKNCNIGQNVFIDNNVFIGNGVKIQNNVSVYNSVIIEDDCFLGPSMVFTNVINPRAHIERKHEYKKTVLKKGSTIGANATIVCGIILGEYCLVGAGTVVIRDIPDYALIVGNPSKQIGWVSEYGINLKFDETHHATCTESGQEYKLENNIVKRIK
jgi:UDP-2-acetamido-3-amino-2,3-dideoxy-glucuronate N-acetyltransferase